MKKSIYHEFETFGKCVEAKFGPEMERKILTNFYTNYGNTKNIFEYMFNNLYSENTTRLVKLNLEINIDQTDECKRKAEARLKNQQLKKQIEKLKAKLDSEDLDTTTVCQSICEQQKKVLKLKQSVKIKEINCIGQEVFIEKVQRVCNKFETAAKSLNFISAEASKELENLRQSDLENIVDENKFIGKVNFIDLTGYCNKKINEDGDNIEKVTGLKYLKNEVDILVYQLIDAEATQRTKPNLNVIEKINQIHLENIRRECERKKWTDEKNNVVAETKDIKQCLNDHLTSNYTGSALQIYAQYLGSHLTYKRVESEYAEVKSALEYFQNEIANFKEVTSATEVRSRSLKNLLELIGKKQLFLEKALDSSIRCLDTDLKFNICQVRSVSERLLELIGSFGNDGLNKTRVDMTFQASGSQLMNGLANVYNQFKAKYLVAEELVNSRTNVEVFSAENRAVFKKLFNYGEFRDQKGLFDQFVKVFRKIQSKMSELNKMNRSQSKYSDIRSMGDTLVKSLQMCKEADRCDLVKYCDLLLQDAKKMKDLRPEIAEIEDLIEIWRSQPGAYECIGEEVTVSGKSLAYFCKIVERIIAGRERMTFNQGEMVDQQICKLVQYCNNY